MLSLLLLAHLPGKYHQVWILARQQDGTVYRVVDELIELLELLF